MQTFQVISAAPALRRGLLGRLTLWLSLRRERSDLSTLDDRLLRDVGLNPAAVRRECERPFWDAPPDRWV